MIARTGIAWQFGATEVEPAADLVVLLLVLALLVEYELLAAYLGSEYRRLFRPLVVALTPLLPLALFIVVVRALGVR